MRWASALFAEFFMLETVLFADLGLAHDAPSGWPYPPDCCNGQDCYEISSDEVELLRDGSYRIRETGEIFFNPWSVRSGPGQRIFRWSLDTNFHRCSWKGERSYPTHCLFVPSPPS
jgi:hypothetical protein